MEHCDVPAALPALRPMDLTLSDPSYTDRLISFFASLGRTLRSPEPGRLVLDEELAELELAMYLRVWHVLHPNAVVTVGGAA
jgi:hypothetical protein